MPSTSPKKVAIEEIPLILPKRLLMTNNDGKKSLSLFNIIKLIILSNKHYKRRALMIDCRSWGLTRNLLLHLHWSSSIIFFCGMEQKLKGSWQNIYLWTSSIVHFSLHIYNLLKDLFDFIRHDFQCTTFYFSIFFVLLYDLKKKILMVIHHDCNDMKILLF